MFLCFIETWAVKMQAPPTALIFFFCYPRKESGLHNHWLFRQHTSTEDFEVTSTADVNGGRFLIILLVFNPGLLRNEGPQLVQIDGRTVLVWSVGMNVEVP